MREPDSDGRPDGEHGGGDRLVGVGEDVGVAADAEQLVREVLRDELAGADAVQEDAVGAVDGRDRRRQHGEVELSDGLLDREEFQGGELGDGLLQRVLVGDLGAVGAAGGELGGLLAELGGQGHAQRGVSGEADRPAESDDGRDRGAALRRELADRLVDHEAGVLPHGGRDAGQGRGQARSGGFDRRLDAHGILRNGGTGW